MCAITRSGCPSCVAMPLVAPRLTTMGGSWWFLAGGPGSRCGWLWARIGRLLGPAGTRAVCPVHGCPGAWELSE
eukprot:9240720-Pyramimonas_sp.AAC.2